MENKDNIKECEGVPNGITPQQVGGMGTIMFPGGGHCGSGDLPSPTGKVYKQIMPFDTFIKSPEWKKKKKKKYKKPNTPDSPYYKHSPNPPEYNHVYDFKRYMDKAKEGL